MENFDYYHNYFSEKWGVKKPLARLFKTDSCYYLYDAGTNKLLNCRKEIFDLLGKLYSKPTVIAVEEFISEYGKKEFLLASEDIEESIKKENILSVKEAKNFSFSPHFNNFEEKLNSSVKNICLEITDKCNLRCDYCINSYRYKSKSRYVTNNMDLGIVYKSVDFLKKHSYKVDKVYISFYGGEPLLQYSKIKSCVDYAKDVLKEKEHYFNITTNATLITSEKAEFFNKNNFSVLVSLDGPPEYHDRYRKDRKGIGSYENTIRGLKILVDSYEDIKKIGLNIVYTPPYSKKKIDAISHHLKKISWLKGVNISTTYPRIDSINMKYVSEDDLKEDKNLLQWGFDIFKNNYGGTEPLAKSTIELKLGRFLQRPVFKKPVDKYFLNGCCLPGEYFDGNGESAARHLM